MKNNAGISMITLIVTIILVIILSIVALNGSTSLIGKSSDAKIEAKKNEDNDTIRALLTYTISDPSKKTGFPLDAVTSVLISGETVSGDKEFGLGYYLVPGGDDDMLDRIAKYTGDSNTQQFKNLSAPYVVDYDNGDYYRLEEFLFKGESEK